MNVFPSSQKPGRDIIERSAGAAELRNAAHLRALLLALVFGSAKGRIAIDEGALSRQQNTGPIDFQRVGVMNIGETLSGMRV